MQLEADRMIFLLGFEAARRAALAKLNTVLPPGNEKDRAIGEVLHMQPPPQAKENTP